MIEIAAELRRWCAEERPFALATLVGVRGSAPMPLGTSAAIDASAG